jgi:Ca2+-binding EF-hand superfamily protein
LFLQVFRSFDEDKSGSIDYVEFRRGLAHIGMELTDQEFGSLLAVVDNDKSVRGLQITL